MDIWKITKKTRNFVSINTKAQRIVESQSYKSTRRLVDSDEEQKILEEEIEKSKPPFPDRNSRGRLHWLLFTPFRYPPLLEGGRFHKRSEQSIFYGAKELETAMAEIAYKRFVFRECTEADIPPMHVDYTSFAIKIKTNKGMDLTSSPFEKYRKNISNPLSHKESQSLGAAMRNHGVEAFSFFSARVPEGINYGLMSVEAFGNNEPVDMREWSVYDSKNVVEFVRNMPLLRNRIIKFNVADFIVKGKLPLFS